MAKMKDQTRPNKWDCLLFLSAPQLLALYRHFHGDVANPVALKNVSKILNTEMKALIRRSKNVK